MDPSTFQQRIVITGGAGFIGSNLALHLVPKYPQYLFVCVDALTYAGNLSNLASLEQADNFRFEKADIRDFAALDRVFTQYIVNGLIHLAAETHVDRSISGPADFVATNIVGTFNLLELARSRSDSAEGFRFHHVSTDEVFGSLGCQGSFAESSPYRPNSPYAATKASADHLVRAYHRTYGLNVVTSNCSNNFGPYQFPEKLIPLIIRNGVAGKELPIYGTGHQVRDWLYVADHCRGLDLVYHKGVAGETYNLGAQNEIRNLDLVERTCDLLDSLLGGGPRRELIRHITDRPGHDRRYAIDATKIAAELGWQAETSFDEALLATVRWYLDHQQWLEACVSGEYQQYYEQNYANR